MIDAVDSGGYGMLGLYAAQSPVVPDPSPPPPATRPDAEPVRAAQAVPQIQDQGSGPLPGAEAGADGSATSGRDFSQSGDAGSRQAAVLAAMAGASAPGAATAGSASAKPSAGVSARALQAYDRAGAQTQASTPSGAMFAARA